MGCLQGLVAGPLGMFVRSGRATGAQLRPVEMLGCWMLQPCSSDSCCLPAWGSHGSAAVSMLLTSSAMFQGKGCIKALARPDSSPFVLPCAGLHSPCSKAKADSLSDNLREAITHVACKRHACSL
eukprot:1160984-Pelagomonas_calceolata.AAC.4